MWVGEAEVADVEAVFAIDRQCSPVFSRLEAYLGLPGDRGLLLVARENDAVLGFAAYSLVLDEATLLNLAVVAERRGQGVGQALLRDGDERLRRRGINRVLLELRRSNAAALHVYTKQGFSSDGRRAGYYPASNDGAAEDAVLMSKHLEEHHARA